MTQPATWAGEHRVIVRQEREGARTYCYCGWASTVGITYDAMTTELYAHLEPNPGDPTLF